MALTAAVVICALGTVIPIATSSPASASTSAANTSVLGVYAGAVNTTEVNSINAASDGQVGYAMDFLDSTSWTKMENPSWWLSSWNNTGYKMIWGVPMLLNNGTTLAQGATGAYDQYYLTLAKNLVAGGQGNSVIRLGWEFNGDWFPWSAASDPETFITYWQQIVTTMRSVAGANFQFEWNPTLGAQSMPAEEAYPGNSYVDIIGLDVYDIQWPSMPDSATEWNTLQTEPYGLNWVSSFAAAHDKPISLPEWGLSDDAGVGGGDNPTFVQEMLGWISSHDVVNAGWWDYQGIDSANPNAYSELISELRTGITDKQPSSTTAAPPTTTSPTTGTPPNTGSQNSTIGEGYRITAVDGQTWSFSQPSAAQTEQSRAVRIKVTNASLGSRVHVVADASTPGGGGYWIVTLDGYVKAFGNARYFGSAGGRISKVVDIAATADGKGYYLVTSAGHVYGFGDAKVFAATRPNHPERPIVGIAVSSNDKGYYLVTTTGGVFTFGDATYYGSVKGAHLSHPVVGMTTTPGSRGYYLLTASGQVVRFGNAESHGSPEAAPATDPMVSILLTPTGHGYWIVDATGTVDCFGDARNLGDVPLPEEHTRAAGFS